MEWTSFTCDTSRQNFKIHSNHYAIALGCLFIPYHTRKTLSNKTKDEAAIINFTGHNISLCIFYSLFFHISDSYEISEKMMMHIIVKLIRKNKSINLIRNWTAHFIRKYVYKFSCTRTLQNITTSSYSISKNYLRIKLKRMLS